MLVITNRNILNISTKDEKMFGEKENEKGASEIRLAHALKNAKGNKKSKWTVDLVNEPEKVSPKNAPSRNEFIKVSNQCQSNNKNCLFYVHGYNKSFEESLEQGWHLQEKYGVEVVLFSWPSNAGGIVFKEYKAAKRTAGISTAALDSIFERLAEYLKVPFDKAALEACDVSISFMAYSMGNLLFKNYIESGYYSEETNIFTNVVLCQADCDNNDHESWVDKIRVGKSIYITINEKDKVLGWSDANFQRDRLGRTVRNLQSKNALYFDFTESKGVGKEHQVWGKVKNADIVEFFRRVLSGQRGEFTPNFIYDSRLNVYRQ